MPKGKKAAAKGGKSAKGKGKDDKEKPKKVRFLKTFAEIIFF